MRVNVYAEEMTDRIEIITKSADGVDFTGLRFYLELPVTVNHPDGTVTQQVSGPFIHRPGDDSSAVTFWGKHDFRGLLVKALKELDRHYDGTAFRDNIAAIVNASATIEPSEVRRTPKKGWIVLFMSRSKNEELPALVVSDVPLNLRVFSSNGIEDFVVFNPQFSDEHAPGTWHWRE